MAQANFVKKAQHPIYAQGKKVKKVHEKGKNKGQEYITYDLSQPGYKDDVCIVAKGESYYWWQFMNGPKHYSTTRPRQSQLTQSAHKSAIYSINEMIEDLTVEDMTGDGCLDEIISAIEEESSTCEDSLSNMPDQLQEAPAGQTLQEYMDALSDLQGELEGIELEPEEPEDDELAQEWAVLSEDDRKQWSGGYEDWKTSRYNEMMEERKQDILDEIQACSANI